MSSDVYAGLSGVSGSLQASMPEEYARLYQQATEIFVTETGRSEAEARPLVEFYLSLAIAAGTGQVELSGIVGHDFKYGFAEIGDLFAILRDVMHDDYQLALSDALRVSSIRRESLSGLSSERIESYLAEDLAVFGRAINQSLNEDELPDELAEKLEEVEPSSFTDDDGYQHLLEMVDNNIQATVNAILEVYDSLFEQGYVLDPNVAMIVPASKPLCFTIKPSGEGRKMTALDTSGFTLLADLVKPRFSGVSISNKRDIDLDDILDVSKPLQYVPLRLAEFILDAQVLPSKELAGQNPHAYRAGRGLWVSEGKDVKSQRSDIEAALFEMVSDLLLRMYEAYSLKGSTGFVAETTDFGTESYPPIPDETYKRILSVLDRFRDSMSTVAFIRSLTGTGKDWAGVEFVLSVPVSAPGRDFNFADSQLYRSVLQSNGSVEPPRVDNQFGHVTTYTFKHVADPVADAKTPYFAYKVFDRLKAQGKKFDKDSVLVGRGEDGNSVISAVKGKSHIQKFKAMVHVLMAGSRMGKGVQTNSSIAGDLVVGKPVGIWDNKPDTGVPYYMLFRADEKGTPRGFFIQGGVPFSAANIPVDDAEIEAELNWDTNPLIYGRKERLVPAWFLQGVSDGSAPIDRYSGNWGYLAYQRAQMLFMGIINARKDASSGHPEIYEKLGGKMGLTAVWDEITLVATESANMFSENGYLAGELVGPNTLAAFKKIKADLDAQRARGDKANPAKVSELEEKLRMVSSANNKTVTKQLQ